MTDMRGIGEAIRQIEGADFVSLYEFKPLIVFWNENALIFVGLVGQICIVGLLVGPDASRGEGTQIVRVGDAQAVRGAPQTLAFLLPREPVQDPLTFWGPDDIMPIVYQTMRAHAEDQKERGSDIWATRPCGYFRAYRGGPLAISLLKMVGISVADTVAGLHGVLAEVIEQSKNGHPPKERFPRPKNVEEAQRISDLLDSIRHTFRIIQELEGVVQGAPRGGEERPQKVEKEQASFASLARATRADLRQIEAGLRQSMKTSTWGQVFLAPATVEA